MTNSLTQKTDPILQYPVKFLGATLLSCSSQMGWGVESSSLEVDLIEDCVAQSGYNTRTETYEDFGPDLFVGKLNIPELIGSAAYFSLPPPVLDEPESRFRFGGIVTNWTTKLGTAGGVTFNVKLSDPRILLDNTMVIIDSYSDLPFQHLNYFNVFSAFEAGVNYGNCQVFGTADSSPRGMVFKNIIKGLLALGKDAGDTNYRPKIYSSTTNTSGYGGLFKLDLGWTLSSNDIYTATLVQQRPDAVPLGPDFYRVSGNVSVLELINNICELSGRNFYVSLYKDLITLENIIKVSTVQLLPFGGSLQNIVSAYDGYAIDLSYGKELRNDKTRKMIFGEQIHYLTAVTDFTPFFGENEFGIPIIPIRDEDGKFTEPDGTTESSCGFWIPMDIRKLNLTLKHPIGSNEVWISEFDIRTALSGYELFTQRILMKNARFANIDDSFIKILQNSAVYSEMLSDYLDRFEQIFNPATTQFQINGTKPVQDFLLQARNSLIKQSKPDIFQDLQKIHSFISGLGQTYYGKQFLTAINENICCKINNEEVDNNGFGEKIYSSVPSNDGGWVDYGVPVLGLADPSLSIFRTDDDRIRCFARFDSLTSTGAISQNIGQPNSSGIASPPSDPSP